MSTGREIVAAVKKGASWGTPVAAGALDGLLLTGETLGVGAPEDLVAQEAGVGFQQTSEAGDVNIEGALSGFLRYDSALWRLIALGMGQDSASQIGATTAYQHVFDFLDSLDGLFGTLALDKGPEVWEFPSAKVIGFSLRGEAGRPLTFEATARCDALNRNTAAGTNNNTTMGSVTYRSKVLRALFQHLTFRLNAQSGAALAGGDAVPISSFALSVTRPHAADHVSGQPGIIEPTEDGLPAVAFQFALPEYAGGTHLDRIAGHTRLKADLTLNSGQDAGGGNNYSLTLSIPQLVLTGGGAAVSAAGKIPHPLSGRCEEAQSAPAGMAGVTKPFRAVAVNQHTTAEI